MGAILSSSVWSENPGQVTALNFSGNRAKTYHLIKHTDWSYEKERRIVVDNTIISKNPVTLGPDAIKGVIFGVRINKADATRVVQSAMQRRCRMPLNFYRMNSTANDMQLHRYPIKDIADFIAKLT